MASAFQDTAFQNDAFQLDVIVTPPPPAPVLPTGHLVIGRFSQSDPLYTLRDEIIAYEQIDEGSRRANTILVDGQEDSWTEYDREALNAQDEAVIGYHDLPELKVIGEVAGRAIEELQNARATSSPGGEITGPKVLTTTRMDWIFWIDEDGNKYQTRIEGKNISGNQSTTPYQRALIDTGVLIFCPSDDTDITYIARDDFERATEGLGDAVLGGTWVTYT